MFHQIVPLCLEFGGSAAFSSFFQMRTDRLKANGVKFSLTRRRESAKWKEASLLRVFAFDSEIP
jgi:hypothetical protein